MNIQVLNIIKVINISSIEYYKNQECLTNNFMNKSFASSYSRVVNITVNFLLVYICFLNDGAALIGWTDRRVYIFNLHHLIV